MFIRVTPIGSTADDVSAAAGAYVDYLCGGAGGASETVGYYASDGARMLDGAGRWSGGGADYLGLAGEVVRNQFAWLLQGRHHQTAGRLISARGSAGRVHLKAGQPSRLIGGQPVWAVSDAAARLGIAAGEIDALAGSDRTLRVDGERFLTMSVLNDLLIEAGAIEAAVTMDQLVESEAVRVTAGDVAEALGVTRRHMTEVCRSIAGGDVEDSAGLAPQKIKGVWHVDRLGALEWVQQREAPAVRVGFDMTLTTEKSLSVFGLLGAADVRAGTVEILDTANDEAMRWLNLKASAGRRKQRSVDSHGLAIASFTHSTSRNDDPFLHVHNVVLNAIADEDGVGRALDATGLFAQAPAAAALATASMRRSLTDRFGVDWRLSNGDTWEIAGIDDQVIEAFSTRRSEIEAAMAELFDEPVEGDLRAEVAASTRGRKSGLTADELAGRWDEVATSVGYDRDARAASVGVRDKPVTDDLSEQDRTRLWRWLQAPEGVTKEAACFDSGDLFWAIANWAPGGKLRLLSPTAIISEARQWLGSEHVRLVADESSVAASGRRIGQATEPKWTTSRILELQQTIANVWEQGRGQQCALVPSRHVNAASRNAEIVLSAEQLELVKAWTSSGDIVQAAVGRPGTGKTTTMAVAVDAWEGAGYTVKGAAVKGEATRLLAKEAGVNARTVASYLAANRMGSTPVDSKTVLIVDEASTLSEWDLGELIAMCAKAGAALRLIGDPAQHTSVQAGGSWAHLVDRFATETPELRYQRRLNNTMEVEATEDVRAGDFTAAFAKLASLGHVEEFDTWSEAYAPIIKRWWSLRQAGKSHPLVERTNANRRVLNSLAQTMRHRAGELGAIVAVGAKAFAVGDEVIAKEQDRDLVSNDNEDRHVLNGSTGVITSIDDDTVLVEFEDLGEISIPRTWAAKPAGLDLAYAMTSYSIQGVTNDASTSMVTQGMGAAELLVDLTRGRDENVLIAIGGGEDEFGREPDDVAGQVARTVRVEDLRPVDERDPVAVALHRSGLSGMSLSQIADGAHGHSRTVRERAVDQRIQALSMMVQHEPPSDVVSLLGPRPSVPWQAARWEKLAVDIAIHNDRWLLDQTTATGRRGPAAFLSSPDDPVGRARRAALVRRIETHRHSHTHIEVGL